LFGADSVDIYKLTGVQSYLWTSWVAAGQTDTDPPGKIDFPVGLLGHGILI
jgi:hypothetical protein